MADLNDMHEAWCMEQRQKYEINDDTLCDVAVNSCKDCKSIFLSVGTFVVNQKVRAL